MKHTGKTYRFRTFQEMVDVVPADRIRDCMEEIGIVIGTSKALAELTYQAAVYIGLPSVAAEEQRIILPDVMEWIDDGKRELIGHLNTEDGMPLLDVAITKKSE